MSTNVTLDGLILFALLTVVSIGSVYISGRIAERRGRSFKTWAYIAAIVLGPLAIPLLFLFPDLRARGGDIA